MAFGWPFCLLLLYGRRSMEQKQRANKAWLLPPTRVRSELLFLQCFGATSDRVGRMRNGITVTVL
ncbi:hypothetical protein EI94DRAFT_1730106 [Lactarius quietus]|nr:hypothetical protein EI94DRAFT_1730106 [Lactarius quietus]